MNAKAQQINHEVIGQHPSQLKGETMNTKMIKDSRKRFLSLTAAGLLSAVMGSNAMANTVTTLGNFDPKDAICVKSNAANSLSVSALASAPITYIVSYMDNEIFRTPVNTINFNYSTFSGAGRYEICARNAPFFGVQLINLKLTTN